jgi:hypothetical protein
MRNVRFLLLLFLVGAAVLGCDDNTSPTLPQTTSGGGFVIATFTSVNGGEMVPEGFVTVSDTWVQDLQGVPPMLTPLVSLLMN